MDATTIKSPEWIDAIPIHLIESVQAEKGKKYSFKAKVLVWDPALDNEWSIISRNGVRYNREASIKQFQSAVKQNNGIPVMYNHIIDDDEADQLGIITKTYDTPEGLVVEGLLNGYKQRVLEEILPGFLNNVSLQVDGEREVIEEQGQDITYAKPTDVYEVSFVPVNGVKGANSLQIALAEAVNQANQRLKAKYAEDATSSNVSGAIGKKLVGTDNVNMDPQVTSSADKEDESDEKKQGYDTTAKEAISKNKIEHELQGIDESFDITDEQSDELYNSACEELKVEEEARMSEMFKEALKEAIEGPSITMDQIQVGIVDLQSAKGIAVEEEHESTYNWIATELATKGKLPPKEHFFRMIAEDHLKEDPMYYDHLAEMEAKYAKPEEQK
jgi:hypothetical protein